MTYNPIFYPATIQNDRSEDNSSFYPAPTSEGAYISSIAIGAGNTAYGRVVFPRQVTIRRMAFVVTGADASNPAVDIGIMDSAGNRIISTGPVLGRLTVAGQVIATLPSPVVLDGNVPYYGAFGSGSSGTPATVAQAYDIASGIFGATVPRLRAGFMTGATIPANAASMTGNVASVAFAFLET